MEPEITNADELGIDKLDDKSDMDLLNESSTEKELDKPVEEDEADEEDVAELDKEDEAEETDEEPEEKEEKDIEGSRLRPSIKDIIKKIPEAEKVFKAFPQLRDAYYREAKFSEMFPTLEDAQDSFDKAEALDVFDSAIRAGSSKELLEAVAKEDKKTLKAFVNSFLPTLHSMDEDLFYDASIPVVNSVIRNLFKAGEKLSGKDGQNMMAAAKILSNHLHGSYDIPESEKAKDPELEAERKKFNEEKEQEQGEKFNTFETSVNERTEKLLNKVIGDGLDPENVLSDFTKSKIIDEVIKRVGKELSSDKAHMNSIGRLWKASINERLSSKSADRIITAFLSRAKQLIPEIRSKVKGEALGTKRKAATGVSRTTRREVTPSRGSERRSGVMSPKDVKWRQKSDLDILNEK